MWRRFGQRRLFGGGSVVWLGIGVLAILALLTRRHEKTANTISREVARDIVEKAYNRSDEVQGDSAGQQSGSRADGGAQGGDRPQAHRLRRDEP
jgi:hypothetical protein